MVILLYSSNSAEQSTNLKFQFYKCINMKKPITQTEINLILLKKSELYQLCFFYYQKADDQDDVLIMFDDAMGKTSQQTWEVCETKDDEVMRVYNLEDDLSETNNLKKKSPKKFEELYANWIELNGQMMEPLF